MKIILKCCLGQPDATESSSDTQHLTARAITSTRDPSIRRRSTPASGLTQACAVACASLPITSCEQWPQRILSALLNLEASLRCSARLVVYSSEGLPWIFAPIDWLAEESDRLTLTHLADVLAHQADDAVAVVRHSRDPTHSICQVISWSPGQALVLEPADHLALPICQPGTHTRAALLLSWDRPAERPPWSGEKHGNTAFSASDLKELRRLAQFLGYGLLGDPQHARYMQLNDSLLWTCGWLGGDQFPNLSLSAAFVVFRSRCEDRYSPDPRPYSERGMKASSNAYIMLATSASPAPAPGLHDLILTLLDGIHDLLLTKFGIQFQPMAALLQAYGSTPGGPSPRTNGGAGAGALDTTQSIGTQLTGSGGCTRQDPSRVRAIKTSLAHTLLLQASKYGHSGGGWVIGRDGGVLQAEAICGWWLSTCTSPSPMREAAATRDASCRFSQRASTNDGGCSRADLAKSNISGTSNARGCFAAAAAAASMRSPSRTAFIASVIVPNASSHVLEDQQPCRDVLVCSKLAGGKVGSILLMAEAAAGPTTPLEPHQQLPMMQQSPLSATNPKCNSGGAAATVVGPQTPPEAAAGDADAMVSTARSSGGTGGRSGSVLAATAPWAATAAADARHVPYQLALYLISSELLPAGVLKMIADELQALLPGLDEGLPPLKWKETLPHPDGEGSIARVPRPPKSLPAELPFAVYYSRTLPMEMFFGTWRTALSSFETSSLSCMAADWRRLQEQLLGQPLGVGDGTSIGTCGIAGMTRASVAGGCGNTAAAAAAAAAQLPPALPNPILESASNSPLSPVAAARSAASTRLFKCSVPTSPVPAPVPANNAASTPPAYCSGGGGLLPSAAWAASRDPLSRDAAVSSQGGGSIRKGFLALLTARDDLQYAQSMPGSAAAGRRDGSSHGDSGVRSLGAVSGRPPCSPTTDGPALMAMAAASGTRTGSATLPLPQVGSGAAAALLHLDWAPRVTLEKPAGAAALDMLITSMRQGLTAAGADEQGEQALRAQDLAAVQLLEVLGRGGQGVVFRGSLHGLETAVKVLTDPSCSGEARGAAAAAASAAAAQPGAPAADGEAAGARSGNDTWNVDTKAGEARMRQAKRGAMEVAVIGTLSHPSIVQVYATFSGVVVVRCQYHDSPHTEMRLCYPGDDLLAGKDPGPLNQVICLEYCDAGTLLTAARAGAFRLPFALPSNGAAFPALVPLYKSLLELPNSNLHEHLPSQVSLALRYLHARKLVHCDLKAANVLLKSSNRDLRGWTCKLSDFGCARMLTETDPKGGADGGGPVGFRTAAPVGTLAHMAPDSLLTTSVDVYSFGVLMWELLMCTTPYAGMSAKDIPRQVIRHHLRPTFHPLAPPDYCALAVRCWSAKPERRPTAMELVGELEHLLAAAQASAEREAQVAAAAASARSGTSRAAVGGAFDGSRRKPLPDLDGGKVLLQAPQRPQTPRNLQQRQLPAPAPTPALALAPAPDSAVDAAASQEGLAAAANIQTAARRLLLQPREQQLQQQMRTPPPPPPHHPQGQLQKQQQATAAPTHPGRPSVGDTQLQQQRGGQCQGSQGKEVGSEVHGACGLGSLQKAGDSVSRTPTQGPQADVLPEGKACPGLMNDGVGLLAMTCPLPLPYDVFLDGAHTACNVYVWPDNRFGYLSLRQRITGAG
ncbi:hypothetical protein VOLCADRAFT_105682 [Volvox carteri f. nagariensis]|uniref:Protein kinase domain-containing protein n=1 Tax=Volvox carteri f. nagariensis TaxID=3068 RepID=D8U2B9_VOLCA|nr:uncharacterized protein VOLCADRAFT_105682 [Volvox carteri f. nagariensis]EFJ46036.1 hypothetical protein VOLCADRAFT_105682 [Volvox carteri f. nagariensis]|eukprot:XP_002952786.1 hypothetical protein VOLCADRAFT_105682 [Volvox carteri f. nagariensis]